ncbi:MAG: AI-2E family transporter [Verrucomicrobia bacterium]|nr:AI-2E family transporter [Verrucomicrobiota bacterium]
MNFPAPTPAQARLFWAALSGIALAVLAALVVGLIWLVGEVINALAPVLWPIAIAGAIAYLLDPVVDFIERKGATRTRAILCVFALALGLVVAFFGSVVPRAVVEARELVVRVPTYVTRLQTKVERWVTEPSGPMRELLRFLPFLPQPATNGLPPGAVVPLVTNAPGETVSSAAAAAPLLPADGGFDPDGVQASPEAATLWQLLLGQDALRSVSGWLAKVLPAVANWIFGQVGKLASWFAVIAGLALVPVYLFYFLMEKKGIQSHWTDYLPVVKSGFKDELVFILSSINDYLIAFFRGQVLVAICDGILYTIGFLLIGLPYAVLIGMVATVLTVIPFVGAIITCVSAVVIAIVQFGDWLHPLLALGVFAIVQTAESLVIQPKIMGDRVGLHPVTIIIAVMVGTTLFGGILGAILAIPFTAALRVLMFRYVWRQPKAEAAPGPLPAT